MVAVIRSRPLHDDDDDDDHNGTSIVRGVRHGTDIAGTADDEDVRPGRCRWGVGRTDRRQVRLGDAEEVRPPRRAGAAGGGLHLDGLRPVQVVASQCQGGQDGPSVLDPIEPSPAIDRGGDDDDR